MICRLCIDWGCGLSVPSIDSLQPGSAEPLQKYSFTPFTVNLILCFGRPKRQLLVVCLLPPLPQGGAQGRYHEVL